MKIKGMTTVTYFIGWVGGLEESMRCSVWYLAQGALRRLLAAVTAKMKRLHILAAISGRFHFSSTAVGH